MQKAADAHVEEGQEAHEHHPPPVPRDPDLPTISDTSLAFFAAGALVVTAVALLVLLD